MTLTNTEVQERLWDAIDDHHTGMLGLTHDSHHFQPMTAFVEKETNTIWFYAKADSDIAEAAAGGAEATYVVQTSDTQACIDGRIDVTRDRGRIDKYWNAHVAAWYPDGKDDPSLVLLRFDAADAGVWVSEAGPIRYAYEVAKANATHTTPDIGEQRDINLH